MSGFNVVEETPEVEEMPSEDVQVVLSTEEFLTAGLDPEGIYRMDIKKMAVKEKVVKQGENQGQKYRAIDAEIHLVERFGGQNPGLLEYPIRVWDYSFGIRGKKLERFRKLFTTAFGPLSTTDKTTTVTINDLCASLIGTDTVWGTLYWKRNFNNPEDIDQVIGYDFSRNPSDLRPPRPFAERVKFRQNED